MQAAAAAAAQQAQQLGQLPLLYAQGGGFVLPGSAAYVMPGYGVQDAAAAGAAPNGGAEAPTEG